MATAQSLTAPWQLHKVVLDVTQECLQTVCRTQQGLNSWQTQERSQLASTQIPSVYLLLLILKCIHLCDSNEHTNDVFIFSLVAKMYMVIQDVFTVTSHALR